MRLFQNSFSRLVAILLLSISAYGVRAQELQLPPFEEQESYLVNRVASGIYFSGARVMSDPAHREFDLPAYVEFGCSFQLGLKKDSKISMLFLPGFSLFRNKLSDPVIFSGDRVEDGNFRFQCPIMLQYISYGNKGLVLGLGFVPMLDKAMKASYLDFIAPRAAVGFALPVGKCSFRSELFAQQRIIPADSYLRNLNLTKALYAGVRCAFVWEK